MAPKRYHPPHAWLPPDPNDDFLVCDCGYQLHIYDPLVMAELRDSTDKFAKAYAAWKDRRWKEGLT